MLVFNSNLAALKQGINITMLVLNFEYSFRNNLNISSPVRYIVAFRLPLSHLRIHVQRKGIPIQEHHR